jgi:hypothetical protein
VVLEKVLKVPRSVIHAICPSPPVDAEEKIDAMNVINQNLHALATKAPLNVPPLPLAHAHWNQI